MRVDLTCTVCGAAYSRFPSQVGPYCSNPCRKRGRHRGVDNVEISEDGLTARVALFARDGLTVRAYAVIDAADADIVRPWRWSLSAGYATRRATTGPKQSYTLGMHREILGLSQDDPRTVDHEDRDRLNNRRHNIRAIPKPGNSQNVPSRVNKTSKHRGVSFEAWSGRWKAQVNVNGAKILSARFATETEAAEAARAARAEHMPFATD